MKIYGQVKHNDLGRTPFPNLDPCAHFTYSENLRMFLQTAFVEQNHSAEELWIKRQKQGKILKIKGDAEEGQKEKRGN